MGGKMSEDTVLCISVIIEIWSKGKCSNHSTVWGREMIRKLGMDSFYNWWQIEFALHEVKESGIRKPERKEPHLVKLGLVKPKDWRAIRTGGILFSWALGYMIVQLPLEACPNFYRDLQDMGGKCTQSKCSVDNFHFWFRILRLSCEGWTLWKH